MMIIIFQYDDCQLVKNKVMKLSQNLVTIHVTILSLFVSPNMVIFWVICQNW